MPFSPNFKNLRILIIGDLMLDHYIHGTVSRISPEAPVPILTKSHSSMALGGAANVANNVAKLGGSATLIGAIGADQPGEDLQNLCDEAKINLKPVEASHTEVKTRLTASGQQLLRYDTPIPALTKESATKLTENLLKEIDSAAAIIISDYAKGVVTEQLRRNLVRAFGGKVVIDPKPTNMPLFDNYGLLTPNLREATEFLRTRCKIKDPTPMESAQKLAQELNTTVLLTAGGSGMCLASETQAHQIPPFSVEAKDPTGAGDVVTAVMGLGLAAGLTTLHAALLANRAAAISVTKVGTYAVGVAELKESLEHIPLFQL